MAVRATVRATQLYALLYALPSLRYCTRYPAVRATVRATQLTLTFVVIVATRSPQASPRFCSSCTLYIAGKFHPLVAGQCVHC